MRRGVDGTIHLTHTKTTGETTLFFQQENHSKRPSFRRAARKAGVRLRAPQSTAPTVRAAARATILPTEA
jgi:hypothetical protein